MFSRSLILMTLVVYAASSRKKTEWKYRKSPEELAKLFEGDIRVSPGQLKNGLAARERLWPNASIPYFIDPYFSLKEREVIMTAIQQLNELTCLRLRPVQHYERDYIYLSRRGSGCYSFVGRIGGGQHVNLGPDCFEHPGVIQHEILHAVGFEHQHNAPSRDRHITIHWENILRGQEHNFERFHPHQYSSLDEEYDYDSIMHYFRTAFSANGLPTTIPTVLTIMFSHSLILLTLVVYAASQDNKIDWRYKQSPSELGEHFQGDIKFTKEQHRNAVTEGSKLWPDRTVPYVIDKVFDSKESANITRAIEEINSKRCLRLRPHETKDKDYINISRKDIGCWSSLGRVGGGQSLNLEESCLHVGIILHELLHAIGFGHQHAVEDRDSFIKINWENVEEGKKFAFDKYPANETTNLGEQYDFNSIMHYDELAFSKNGGPTISSKVRRAKFGQRSGFSDADLRKLKKLYKC